MRSLTGALAGMVMCLAATPAAAERLSACPLAQIMTPSEIDARWQITRAAEAREGIVRTIELASRWRHTRPYSIERMNQNGSNEVSTVSQSGPWRRIDRTFGGMHLSEFINLETGVRATLRTSRFNDHPDTTFEATRPHADDWRRWRVTNTGRRETHLGERCTVSRFDPIEPQRHELTSPTQPTEICLTRDGIELWRRTASPPGMNNGEPMEAFVTTRISRAAVAPEDVQPPREMLTWPYWRQHADDVTQSFASADQAAADDIPDYSACYQEEDGAQTREERFAGPWSYRQRNAAWVTIAGPGLLFQFYAHDDGQPYMLRARTWRPLRLDLSPQPNLNNAHPPEYSVGGAETILGERCVWRTLELIVGNEPMSSWCTAADGVTLALNPPRLAATTLQRAPLPAEAFRPPARAFSWITE